jgi:hypothetical protein
MNDAMNIRTHICADEDEPMERHHRENDLKRERYWADPEKHRAQARARYARNIEKNRKRMRERMRRVRAEARKK